MIYYGNPPVMGTGYTYSEAEVVRLLQADDKTVLQAFAQCINFPADSRHYLSWGSTRHGLVHRFHTALQGLGRMYGPYSNGLFKWQTTNKKETIQVIRRLYNYMDEHRQEKALGLVRRMLGTQAMIQLFAKGGTE